MAERVKKSDRELSAMNEINMKLNVDEANLMLEALGNMPFVRVFALIAKIQEQAGQHVDATDSQNSVSMTDSASSPVIE